MPSLEGSGKRILLVEDDPDSRVSLTLVLQSQGHRVDTASDGLEALNRLRADPCVDLILLDLMMPRMDGWEFRRAQLADPRLAPIPVILLSGAGTLAAEADLLGEVGYMHKPIDIRALEEKIQCFARLRRPEVLVVEDDPQVSLMLQRALRHFGFFPRVVNKGRNAVEFYRDQWAQVDLVLLDVQMPDMDGPQTLAALQQINPQVRAVFMSGNIGKYTTEELLALGAVRVFQKPFILSQLSDALWALLDGPPHSP